MRSRKREFLFDGILETQALAVTARQGVDLECYGLTGSRFPMWVEKNRVTATLPFRSQTC